jgi:single-strand DNA-binding protein
MYNLNEVKLIGNLGSSPELKYTNNKRIPVANFSIATNERWKDDAGNSQERVEWHKIVCWGPLAEMVTKHLSKGHYVYVSGKNTTRKFEDKNGVTHYATEVMVQTVGFLQPRDRAGEAAPDPEYVSETSPRPDDKDIPF